MVVAGTHLCLGQVSRHTPEEAARRYLGPLALQYRIRHFVYFCWGNLVCVCVCASMHVVYC